LGQTVCFELKVRLGLQRIPPCPVGDASKLLLLVSTPALCAITLCISSPAQQLTWCMTLLHDGTIISADVVCTRVACWKDFVKVILLFPKLRWDNAY